MKAAQINEYGDASVIKVNEVATPVIQDTQVLVEVHASSINPFDITVRSGYVKDSIPLELPVTLGGDVAGVVTEVGSAVTHLAVGDKVYGQASAVVGDSGAFAEYAAMSAKRAAKSPEGFDFKEAASLPLVGVSALQSLTEHINLQKNQKIFITGGSGGIGTIAIQIAKHIGAYVATTTTGEGLEAARQLGADEVIDYKTQDFTELLNDYDAVFDTAGGDNFDKALHVLRTGGVAVSMIAPPNEALASELGVTAMMQMTRVTTDKLVRLAQLVEEGVVKPQVNSVFSLDDIAEAFRAKETGDAIGKIVIEVR